ncbi:hypothetical protein AB0F24_27220 [Streptomyces platensis]
MGSIFAGRRPVREGANGAHTAKPLAGGFVFISGRAEDPTEKAVLA